MASLSAASIARFARRPTTAGKRRIYDAYVAAFTAADGQRLFDRYGVSGNSRRLAHFMAQAAHETGGFTLVRESLHYKTVAAVRRAWRTRAKAHSDAWIEANLLGNQIALGDWAYGGHMGNRKGTRDGYDYRGGGTFQTTGRSGYRAKGRTAGIDLEGNPRLIEEPLVSLHAACAEWGELGCNGLADADQIRKISRGINRGNVNATSAANGEADRIAWFDRIWPVLR